MASRNRYCSTTPTPDTSASCACEFSATDVDTRSPALASMRRAE